MDAQQTVKIGLIVPKGDYCWEFDGSAICQYYNNYRGPGDCDIFPHRLTSDTHGYLKCDSCKKATVAQELERKYEAAEYSLSIARNRVNDHAATISLLQKQLQEKDATIARLIRRIDDLEKNLSMHIELDMR